MQTLEISENLISQLKELHNKKAFLPNIEFNNLNLSDLKKEIQLKLNSLKSSSKIYTIIAYVLLSVTGTISLMKVLNVGLTPDLNKAALLIFFTVTNSVMAFGQKIKIEKLEKQFLLIDMLEKVNGKK